MANLKAIQGRMQAILKTSTITKAMYNISFSKISNANKIYFNNLAFMEKLENLMYDAARNASEEHPLLATPKKNRRLYIIITSDKGLAGPYHNQLFKFLEKEFMSLEDDYHTLVIGKKGHAYANKHQFNIINKNKIIPSRDDISTMILSEYSDFIKNYVLNNKVDQIYICYNHYISSARSDVKLDLVLPLEKERIKKEENTEYLYEDDSDMILSKIANLYIESKIYHALADAKLSEHSARMMAMKAATDNAEDIVKKLTIIYNQARQQAITSELIDVINGS